MFDSRERSDSHPSCRLGFGESTFLKRKPRPHIVRVHGTDSEDEKTQSAKTFIGEEELRGVLSEGKERERVGEVSGENERKGGRETNSPKEVSLLKQRYVFVRSLEV